MKIVFVSNFLNHHQASFCEALQKHCENFYFIATEARKNIGFQKSIDADYIIRYYECPQKAENEILSADAVIFGACPNELIAQRMSENKLAFLFSERFFKKGTWRRFIPQTREKIIHRIVKYKDKNIYVLCASAYLPYDLSLLRYPKEKCFQWAYFPENKVYTDINRIMDKKERASILWAGRLLKWKHPEVAVAIALRLKKAGYRFQLRIIGNGELNEKLLKMIKRNHLHDCVHLLGALRPEQVREYMETSEIFLFTSDRYEGWGAVLNEAMNSGCAVVGSHMIGSVPFLIENQINGFIYQNGNLDDLYEKVQLLLEEHKKSREFGIKAYQTITEHWNAEKAAERLYRLIEHLGESHGEFYQDGVCSRANVIKENWCKLKI